MYPSPLCFFDLHRTRRKGARHGIGRRRRHRYNTRNAPAAAGRSICVSRRALRRIGWQNARRDGDGGRGKCRAGRGRRTRRRHRHRRRAARHQPDGGDPARLEGECHQRGVGGPTQATASRSSAESWCSRLGARSRRPGQRGCL